MAPINILVIDDERVICNGCRMVLKEKGYRVETCVTCKQGIDAVLSGNYDLVLLDMKLPDMDGTELLKTVQEKKTGPCIIVMTGYATVKNAVESMKLGAVEFLPKPFTDDELIAIVEKVIQSFC